MGNEYRKSLKKLFKELESEQGARIEIRRKGWMIYPPDASRSAVMIHKTPSDRRAWANMLSELRRSGFTV
ncbi:hypothetical protein [Cutibacterium namnetense]|uniref:Conserved domain protein n=1 Tax=[Propionibacterium] namnetense SK182B-JCVI TaxID=1051006 RepID=F9NUP0_9ACTN|nr:hypothetical protein [Cutibacterium namnetense]EGR97270.1 conserved domain protein [ [[Propionibacterium] namnetense SK182B-JCVI]TKW64491.1 MAG: hypothetical protein DI612_07885 [Streptococcus thermophilus]